MDKWTPDQMPDQNGKVAIVTGANSGLGYQTALALSSHGAQVVFACRSREKTEVALTNLRAAVPAAQAEFMALDLADLASVAQFAQAFKARFGRLDILLNNAGVMALPLMRTAQGFEMQMGTNHFGHFALTGQLWDLLRATQGARVVTTSSLAHTFTRGMDLSDPHFEHKRYGEWDAYGKSKLANLLFTYELNRRAISSGSGVVVAAAHPGFAATNLQSSFLANEKSWFKRTFTRMGNALSLQSAERGAWPQPYAATMAGVKGGEYFGPDGFGHIGGHPTRVTSNRASRDEATAKALWTLSETLTGTTYR